MRRDVLEVSAPDPPLASAAVFSSALGPEVWKQLPGELRELFTEASPAVLAEIRGSGPDLSEDPWRLADDELANIALPTLLVSSEDSPAMFRNVNDRLAAALPLAERATVSGGHLISPTHPVVADYLSRLLGTAS